MNILLALLLTFTAQAEVNFIDQFGKENLAWEQESQKTADTMSDIALYTLITTALVYPYKDRGWKHGLAATATLGVNAGLNQLVKHAVGRERPNERL